MIQSLMDDFLSANLTFSFFAIKILNDFFISSDENRMMIYQALISVIENLADFVHAYILLQVFVKLLDFALPPSNCPKDQIELFLSKSLAMVLYVFSFPSPIIKDVGIAAIERLDRFATSFSTKLVLKSLLRSDFKLERALKVRLCIDASYQRPDILSSPDQNLSFVDALRSNFFVLAPFYLCEAIQCHTFELVQAGILSSLQSIIVPKISTIEWKIDSKIDSKIGAGNSKLEAVEGISENSSESSVVLGSPSNVVNLWEEQAKLLRIALIGAAAHSVDVLPEEMYTKYNQKYTTIFHHFYYRLECQEVIDSGKWGRMLSQLLRFHYVISGNDQSQT